MPTFDSRGFEIYYETHGGGDGVPLVLIMGMGGTCQGWTVLTVPELSRDRMTVIFDNRGAGRSQDPGGDFSTFDMAQDTIALLDHLGVARAHVLGAFLGGQVAQEIAIQFPERVRSLVLSGTFARVDAKRRAVLEVWRAMIEADLPAEALMKHRLVWTLHDLTFEQDDLIEAFVRFYTRDDVQMERKVFGRQVSACIEHDALDRLEKIGAPTLVVCGEQDALSPMHMHRQIANRIPGARLVQISGAAHLVAAEQARRYNRLISRFLMEYDA